MNITIFGSGYVGLVTAVCFADAGNDVLCADVDGHALLLRQMLGAMLEGHAYAGIAVMDAGPA